MRDALTATEYRILRGGIIRSMGRTRKVSIERLGRMSADSYSILCEKHGTRANPLHALGRLSDREYGALIGLGRISQSEYRKCMEGTDADRLSRGGIRKLRSKR